MGGHMLSLQAPAQLSHGEEGIVRLSITNQTDTLSAHLHLELTVPGWAEPAPPRPGDREVSMIATEDGGTRFLYRMDNPPVEPNRSQVVEQRIPVPAQGPLTDGSAVWSRAVRARLLDAQERALAEVESEISIEGVTVGSAAVTGAAEPADRRHQLGALRLGMSGAEARRAAQGSRDTTWTAGSTQHGGISTQLPSGGHALVATSNDSVVRIEVRDPEVRTREGLGVGSPLEELRAGYGRPCADVLKVPWWYGSRARQVSPSHSTPRSLLRRNEPTHWSRFRPPPASPAGGSAVLRGAAPYKAAPTSDACGVVNPTPVPGRKHGSHRDGPSFWVHREPKIGRWN